MLKYARELLAGSFSFPFQRWPEAEFFIVPDAGHSALEPGITSRLVQATDKYKTL